ncbi:MAG: N,N-dimethylformamidase beta subunit family domain-containing protein, partial [Pirellulales bacterium]
MLRKSKANRPRRAAPRARLGHHLSRSLLFEAFEDRRLLAALSISAENALPGTSPDEWDVGFGSSNIEGYATRMSIDQGETVEFKVSTDADDYHIDIYRTGYYGGLGARYITTINPNASLAQNQPNPVEDSDTGLIDAGNWRVSAQWNVPDDATSGVYLANLIRDDGVDGASQIIFIVRDDDGQSDVVYKTSDTTWQAYNNWGGNSLYEGTSNGRAYAVSYNRPMNYDIRSYNLVSYYFGTEHPMVRFMERNGYDVSYIASMDLVERSSLLMTHEVIVTTGHDEYWSAAERNAVIAARDAGVSVIFGGGNDVFWKTYWESSSFDSATPDRTLVTYKSTHDNAIIDPVNPDIWTGTWRDPRFSPPADGSLPENALIGTLFMVNSDGSSHPITVPATNAPLRFWRNTSVANLSGNQTATISDRVIGEEWNEDIDNGFRPAGLIQLSSSTLSTNTYLQDYGSTYAPGTSTHTLTMYRAASGALVFSAGSQQFVWGLDANHDGNSSTADSRLQQAMANLFADMGAQPTTLMAGLVPASMSTDTLAPTSTITSPANGANLPSGSSVTISGTAQDGGGGVVAAVEVSVDGGLTWHPATGRANWTLAWTPRSTGEVNIRSRAIDDSGNIGSPGPGITINPQASGPYSLWNNAGTPSTVNSGDGEAVEVGVRFMASTNGSVSGVRFYKGAANTGTHTGSLWTASGQLLATATFTGESSSGWQQVNFANPVAVTAGTTYTASYHTDAGNYSVNLSYFTKWGIDSGPLHAMPEGSFGHNGVYLYGDGGFPIYSFQGSNYWVDVVLSTVPPADGEAPTVTAFNPVSGATNVATGAAPTVTFSETLNASTVNTSTIFLRNASNVVIPSTVAYNSSTNTATLTPTSALAASTTYTIVVKGGSAGVKDQVGNALVSDVTSSFTTAAAADTTAPTVTSFNPANGASNVAAGAAPTVTFSETLNVSTINTGTIFLRDAGNVVVPSTVAYNSSTNTATLTPSAALANSTTYTIVVKGGSAGVKDLAGNALVSDATSSFTTAAASTTSSLWAKSVTPAIADSGDSSSIELGVKFSSNTNGFITGLWFYKGAANTGTHTGKLWSASGQLLATANFTGESASGWQQVNFANPVAVTAGTTYTASYHANSGHY